jgi:hypothetical protein
MIFKHYDKQQLLNFFPQFELSYEKTFHKKVFNSNIYLTIPKGLKYFAWFFRYKNKPLCFLLNINKRRNRINDIQIYHCCFDDMLTMGKGTILYGTLFDYNNQSFFNIEDIFYFKGNNITNKNMYNKLTYINTLMNKYIKQISYTKNTIIFGIPNYSTDHNKIKNIIEKLPYTVYSIQHRLLFKQRTFLNELVDYDTQKYYGNFTIKPSIETDIYYSYFQNDKNKLTLEKHGILHIPDYKTSVFMNSLFRIIKENKNLDFLEESDDEEEFENINQDKYVYLNRSYKIKCIYNSKFKKWIPLELNKDGEISTKRTIYSIENKF